MKKWFNTNWLYIAGATLGAVAGYVYWMQIGCTSGTCAITSKPFNTSIYGALLGALVLGIFKKDKSINTTKESK
jgi:hypothetical protein